MEEKETNNQQPEPESKERRSALKKIAVGVGTLAGMSVLPEKWTQPIVSQIVLPAHAGTSGSSLNDPCTIEVTAGDQTTSSVTVHVSGFVTPPSGGLSVSVAVTPQPIGVAFREISNTTTAADGTFSVNTTVNGGPGITSVDVVTNVAGVDGQASCSVSVPAGEATTPPIE